MALESSFWQRNKRNFIFLLIIVTAVLISALAIKAYRNRKRFNGHPHSTLPMTKPNSNSSIPSTEVELYSSISPREQGEKVGSQEQKQQGPQIGEQAVKQQNKLELQGKEHEHLRLSASLVFLPVPRQPEAQNTLQNVSAAPASHKPAPIPQAQHEKGSDWQGILVIFALSLLFTLFFLRMNRGLLGIAIIMLLIPGYGCFVTTEVAIKLWTSQRKFSLHRKGVVVEGQITDRRVIPDPRAIRRSFSFTRLHRFTTYYIRYSYAYDGKTYSHWLEVPRKHYKVMHIKRSVAVSLLSNMPTMSSLKGFNQIRRDAAFFTGFAIFYLGLILCFVFFAMLPNISYLIKGDPPAAPSNTIPGIPNTNLCTGVRIDPSCGAKQVFDDYCFELSNGGETPPYLYLTSTSSKHMPGRTGIHGGIHKQVLCWLLEASVGSVRPLRTSHSTASCLPIP